MVEQFGVATIRFFAEVLQGVAIHLGDDEGDVRVQAERRRLVDADGAGGGGPWGPRLRDAARGREEDEVDALEVEALEVPSPPSSGRPRPRCSRRRCGLLASSVRLASGKRRSHEDVEGLAADDAGGADDGDVHRPLRRLPRLGPGDPQAAAWRRGCPSGGVGHGGFVEGSSSS
jgi:hypothetical protein